MQNLPLSNKTSKNRFSPRLSEVPYDLFEYGDPTNYYLVLEYIPGLTIHSIPKKILSEDVSLHASGQLLNALTYAISLDYFFLDLHGGNLMITESHDLKVIDLVSFFSCEEFYNVLYVQKKSPQTLGKKMEIFLARHPNLWNEPNAIKREIPSLEKFRLNLQASHFKDICFMCNKIIGKSSMEKQGENRFDGRDLQAFSPLQRRCRGES